MQIALQVAPSPDPSPVGRGTHPPHTLPPSSRQAEGLSWGRGWKGEGKGREREVEVGKERAPKLLLNQGPS